MNDCITTTKQSTTKPCAYFLEYTVLYSLKQHRDKGVDTNYINAEERNTISDQCYNLNGGLVYGALRC